MILPNPILIEYRRNGGKDIRVGDLEYLPTPEQRDYAYRILRRHGRVFGNGRAA